jgi:hypothetical protein
VLSGAEDFLSNTNGWAKSRNARGEIRSPVMNCGRRITRSQAFLSSFDLFRQHFALTRHFLRASLDRDNPANALRAGRSCS